MDNIIYIYTYIYIYTHIYTHICISLSLYICIYIYISIYIYIYIYRSSGMWCLRMWCLIIMGFTSNNMIVYHDIRWQNDYTKHHILKHHILELPIYIYIYIYIYVYIYICIEREREREQFRDRQMALNWGAHRLRRHLAAQILLDIFRNTSSETFLCRANYAGNAEALPIARFRSRILRAIFRPLKDACVYVCIYIYIYICDSNSKSMCKCNCNSNNDSNSNSNSVTA